jgi:arylformamidase
MDLTDDYENRKYIPDAETYSPRWEADAATLIAKLGDRARIGIPYAAGPREKFNLFLPDGAPKGLMIFIHGGYWHSRDRHEWASFANGALDRGWAVAMPGYTLAPDVRLTVMARNLAHAVDTIAAAVPDVPIVLTGHSAGGHLAARLACRDLPLVCVQRIRRVVPISPITDLHPLMQTSQNTILQIGIPEAKLESPALLQKRDDLAVQVWVGGSERPVFIAHAASLGTAWSVPVTVVPGLNHFSIIDALRDAESTMTNALLREA